MPIYEVKGRRANVKDDSIDRFIKQYPDAKLLDDTPYYLSKVNAGSKDSNIPKEENDNVFESTVKNNDNIEKESFNLEMPAIPDYKKQIEDIRNKIESPQNSLNNTINGLFTNSLNNENENIEPIHGFIPGFEQGTKALVEGSKVAGANIANVATGSARDAERALDILNKYGTDYNLRKAYNQDLQDRYNTEMEKYLSDKEKWFEKHPSFFERLKYSLPFIGDKPEEPKNPNVIAPSIGDFAGWIGDKVDVRPYKLVEEALKQGDIESAKNFLKDKAANKTWGDKVEENAIRELATLQPTKGFAAWVGNLTPQMIPNLVAVASALHPATRSLAKPLAHGGMAVLSLSSGGSAIADARQYAEATGIDIPESTILETGALSTGIEIISEKIPIDRYLGRFSSKYFAQSVSKNVAKKIITNPIARRELSTFFKRAAKDIPGLKHITSETAKRFAGDLTVEGLSEFSAEALGAMVPMLYAKKEDYPTLSEILENGWEGFKGGVFMGGVLGGVSHLTNNFAQNQRRKKQGSITLMDTGSEIVELLSQNNGIYTVLNNKGEAIDIPSTSVLESHTVGWDEFRDFAKEQRKNNLKNDDFTNLEASEKRIIKENYTEQEKKFDEVFANTPFADTKDELLNASPKKQGEIINSILTTTDLTEEQKVIAIDFIIRGNAYKSYRESVNDVVDNARQEASEEVEKHTNPDMNAIVIAKIGGYGDNVRVYNGNIVHNSDGTINRNKSSQFVTIIDKDGNKIPISIDHIDEVVNIIPAEEATSQLSDLATEEVISKYENDEVREYTIGEMVTADIYGNGIPFTGQITKVNEKGNYIIVDTQSGQQAEVEPRQIINQDNLLGVDNGSLVEYRTDKGEIVEGTVNDAYGLRQQGVMDIDNNIVPIKDIIGLVRNTKEETLTDSERPVEIPEESNQSATTANEEGNLSFIQQIPQNESGNLLFEQVPIETTIGALNEVYKDATELSGVVDATISNIDKQIDKAKAKSPKPTGDITKDIANKQKANQQIEELNNRLSYWQNVNALIQNTKPIDERVTEQLTGEKNILPLEAKKEKTHEQERRTEIPERVPQTRYRERDGINPEMERRTSDNRGRVRTTSKIESPEVNQKEQGRSTNNLGRDATSSSINERAQSSSLGGNTGTIQNNLSREDGTDNKLIRERHTANDRARESQRLAMDIRNGIQDKSKQKQLDFIETYAKENDYWVENTNILGSYLNEGGENEVLHNQGTNTVFKLNNFEFAGDDIVNLFDRLDAHNQLFPKVAYTLRGFAKNSKGEISAVLEQPYITEASDLASVKEISEYMQDLGFEQVNEDTYVNKDYEVFDVVPDNVLLGMDGSLYPIDTQIRKRKQAQTQTETQANSLETELQKTLSDTASDLSKNKDAETSHDLTELEDKPIKPFTEYKQIQDREDSFRVNVIPNTDSAYDKQARAFIDKYVNTIKGKQIIKFTKDGSYEVFGLFDKQYPSESNITLHASVEDTYKSALSRDIENMNIVRSIYNKETNTLSLDYYNGSLFGNYVGELYANNGYLKEEVKDNARKEIEEHFGIKEDTTKSSNNIRIIEYSDKSIAVYGNTKEIKDQLKAIGGRFNPKLKDGAGWIFPKKKEKDVRNLIKGQSINDTIQRTKKPTPFQRRLNEVEENVHTIRDRILFGIASGAYKFRWKDNGVSMGLARELGLSGSEAERKARIGLLSNNGYTPSTLAHLIWEETGGELNDNDIRNDVIDVINSVYTRKQALEALENNIGITEEQYQQQQEEASEYELELRAKVEARYNEILSQQIEEDLVSLKDEAVSLGATLEQIEDVRTPSDFIDLIEQLQDGQQEQTSDRAGSNSQTENVEGEGENDQRIQRSVSERSRSEESTGNSRQNSDSAGNRISLSFEEQRVINEATAQIDAEIAEAKKGLTTQQKELLSAKKRLGKAQADTIGNLFGKEQQSTLFDVPADLSKENAVDNILSPIQQQIDAAQTNLDTLTNSRDARIQEALDNYRKQGNLLDEIARAKAETDTNPTEASSSAYGASNRVISTEEYEELRKRMQDKLNNLNSGFDPELFTIGTQMAMYHIEAGARKFADFANRMTRDLGDNVRPYLKSFYEGARQMPSMENMRSEMDSFNSVNSFDLKNLSTFEKETTKPNSNETNSDSRSDNSIAENGGISTRATDANVRGRTASTQTNGRTQSEQRPGVETENVEQRGRSDRDRGSNAEPFGTELRTRGTEGISDNRRKDTGDTEQSGKPLNANNNRQSREENVVPRGNIAKINANIAAIKLVKRLIETGKKATPEQMNVLRRYTGWGGLSSVFQKNDKNYKALQDLLTEEEYDSARASTTTAFYTPSEVTASVWDMIEKLGFKGGNILEPSAGIGNFFALMPENISNVSRLRGVEIDTVSGSILKLLYPDANINISGFEKQRIANNSMDLVVSNVPFGNFKVYDSNNKDISTQFDIHDYFIAKSIRTLKAGGIGVFITTSSTLDKSSSLRNWVVNNGNADFVDAVRLNTDTFKNDAGTEATADIIIIRKREIYGIPSYTKDMQASVMVREATYNQQEKDKWGYNTGEVEKKARMVYNKYFLDNPMRMAGEMKFGFEGGNAIRPTEQRLAPVKAINQQEVINQMIEELPSDIYNTTPAEQASKAVRNNGTNEGGLTIIDGQPYIIQYNEAVPVDWNSNKAAGYPKEEVLQDYLDIKNTISELLEAESSTDNELVYINKTRTKLNKAYDKFVKKYGNLNENKKINFLQDDIDFPSVAAIENIEDTNDGVKIVSKSDIFTKRVIDKQINPKADNVEDAIRVSINQNGKVDIPYIAQLLDKTNEEIQSEIVSKRIGFVNPETGLVEARNQYLSGNVRDKLSIAQQANQGNEYNSNIEELSKVIPADIPINLIKLTLGSTWVPTNVYEDFFKETFDVGAQFTKTSTDKYIGKFSGKDNAKDIQMGMPEASGSTLALNSMNNTTTSISMQVWEDGKRKTVIDPLKTAQAAAKQSEISETFEAWVKQNKKYDEELENIYNNTFNAVVNSIVEVDSFDRFPGVGGKVVSLGSKELENGKELHQYRVTKENTDADNELVAKEAKSLGLNYNAETGVYSTTNRGNADTFAKTLNGTAKILRQHQKEGVIRGLESATLLAHEVGTGKTLTLITTAMEMRRLGLAKKPTIIVQRSTYKQFVKEIKNQYPNAKVLAPSAKDLTAKQREQLFAKIAYNDWDIVVLYHSYLDSIPDNPQRVTQYINEKIQDKMDLLEEMERAKEDGAANAGRMMGALKKEIERLERDRDNTLNPYIEDEFDTPTKLKRKRSIKDIEKVRSNAEAKAEKSLDRRTDNTMTFEQLGIDALLIDEAHAYKKLGFVTSLQRVKGIDTAESKRAQSTRLKSSYILENHNGKNIVLATGTPISNTMAEMWTFMRYLYPYTEMERLQMNNFDAFVNNFGSIEESAEFGSNGKFRITNRFSSYSNVPELIAAWRQVAHTVLTEEVSTLKEGVGTPRVEGGKPADIMLEQTPPLKSVMKAIKNKLEEFDRMSGAKKKENSYIPLVMFGLAKRAAIDVRLVDPNLPDHPDSKLNRTVAEVVQDLKDTQNYKGTIAIFCDSYQSSDRTFNVFRELKQKLVDSGIPAEQVAIINDFNKDEAREKLFTSVNKGDVRVVLGTTEKLGVGVNIQERLHMAVHMDAPLRPSDYQQRNGRIMRQGNTHLNMDKTIKILRIGVQKTLDVTGYQRLEIKKKFIDQIMKGDISQRMLEEADIESTDSSNFNQMMANLSGSQAALALSIEQNKLKKLQNSRQYHADNQVFMAGTVRRAKSIIVGNVQAIDRFEGYKKELSKLFPEGKVTTVSIGKVSANTPEEIGTLLSKHITKRIDKEAADLKEDFLRKNAIIKTSMLVNGIKIDLEIDVKRNYDVDTKKTRVTREIQYITPNNSIENPHSTKNEVVPLLESKVGANIYNVIEEINDLLSGYDIEREIQRYKIGIDKAQRDIDAYEPQIGKPFAEESELKAAEEKVEALNAQMEVELKQIEEAESKEDVEAIDISDVVNKNVEGLEDDLTPPSGGRRQTSSSGNFQSIPAEKFDRLVDKLTQTGLAVDVVLNEDIRNNPELQDPEGNVYGYVTPEGVVHLDATRMNANTPIHEFGHLWNSFIKSNDSTLYNRGIELIMKSPYWERVNNNSDYAQLSESEKADEALAMAIGDKGEFITNRKLKQQFIDWLSEVWRFIKRAFGINTNVSLADMTLSDFTDRAVQDLLRGDRLTEVPVQSNTTNRQINIDYEAINNNFNKELEQQINGALSKGHIYQIGIPSNVLIFAGIPNLPIEMASARLLHKSNQDNHPFELSEIMDLPFAVQNPLAVFRSATHLGSNVILTELKQGLKNFVVAVETNRKQGKIEINSIRSIHPRTTNNLIGWINEGLMDYANKEKLSEWLIEKMRSRSYLNSSNPADVKKLLDSATKVVNEFENPSNNIDNIRFQSVNDAERFSKIEELNQQLNKGHNKFIEGWQDDIHPVYKWIKSLREDGMRIADYDDYPMQYTSIIKKTEAQGEVFRKEYLKPLIQIIGAIQKKDDISYRDVISYMILKHGPERNEKMCQNDIDAYKVKNPEATEEQLGNITRKLGDKDYAGVEKVEEEVGMEAQEYTSLFEQRVGKDLINNLWEKIRKATSFSIEEEHKAGLISTSKKDEILSMYKYYIPLRGHDAETMEDVYDYGQKPSVFFTSVHKKTQGRTSRADDPIAYIALNAQTAIWESTNNIHLQQIKRIAARIEQDAIKKKENPHVTVSKTWYQKVGEKEDKQVWSVAEEVAYPQDRTLTPKQAQEEYRKNIEAYETHMKELAAKGEALRSGDNKLKVGMFIKPAQARQHEVHVWQNGTMHTIRFNTNPSIPRAINKANLIRADRYNASVNKLIGVLGSGTRILSAMYTTFRPAFTLATNPLRDVGYTFNRLLVREGWAYSKKALKNYFISIALIPAYMSGKVSLNNKYLGKYMIHYANFIGNGGPTGLSDLMELKDVQKQIQREIKIAQRGKAKGVPILAKKYLISAFKNLTEWPENVSRFSTYLTSVEMGRTIPRAIYDAKNVTVDFNKKGSGAFANSEARALFAFINAGVQGTANLIDTFKTNPLGVTASIAGYVIFPAILLPLLNSFLAKIAGDDDEEKWKKEYAKLSDVTRNNNVCLYTGEGFVTIPLNQEFRTFNGLGANYFMWKEGKMNIKDIGLDLVKGLSDLVAYNPLASAMEGSVADTAPTTLIPWGQVQENSTFYGSPIYNQYANSALPAYRQVRRNRRGKSYAPESLVEFYSWFNELTGGDKSIPGWISKAKIGKHDFSNPDIVNHYLSGYVPAFYNPIIRQLDNLRSDESIVKKMRKLFVPGAIYKPLNDLPLIDRYVANRYQDISNQIDEARKQLRDKKKNASGWEEVDMIEKKYPEITAKSAWSARLNAIRKAERNLKQLAPEEQDKYEILIANMKEQLIDQYDKGINSIK